MTKDRRSFTLDEDLVREIDVQRGYEPRSSFINRKLREIVFIQEKESQ